MPVLSVLGWEGVSKEGTNSAQACQKLIDYREAL